MTHLELCKRVAEWAVTKADVVLYDYQSYATEEFPDCLAFDGFQSTLYEIKVERSDFLADAKKECRKNNLTIKERVYFWETTARESMKAYSSTQVVSRVKEKPHMGRRRFYVCPSGLIQPEETGCWGLFWFKNNKFYLKKDSVQFRNSLYEENAILCHALRKEKNVGNLKVLVKPYKLL